MGKAIPRGLKTKAEFLMKSLPEKFSADFSKNKKAIVELSIPFTKLNRNLVAGYITRRLKKKMSAA